MRMKHVLAVASCLVLGVSLCGCGLPGQQGVRPEGDAVQTERPAETRTAFTQEALLEDYNQLWLDLKENYPFFPVLEAKGIVVSELEGVYRERLLDQVRDVNGLINLLNSMFQSMDSFAHLGVTDTASFQIYYDVYRQHLDEEQALSPWDHAVCAPQTEAIYAHIASLGAKEQMESGKQAAQRYPSIQTAYYPDLHAAYLRFPTFQYWTVERDASVVFDYLASLEDVPVAHIILDVTSNLGGSDSYWMNNIVLPFGGTYEGTTIRYLKDSPMSHAYFDDCELLPLSALPAAEPVPAFVQQLELELFCASPWNVSDKSGSIPTVSLQARQAKRWVLVNNFTFSSADSFATFCKESGWATLVGQSTMGDGGLGSAPCFLTLQNTGLLVRFSLDAFANTNGELNALYGTVPDILAKPKEAPLHVCKRLIAASEPSM